MYCLYLIAKCIYIYLTKSLLLNLKLHSKVMRCHGEADLQQQLDDGVVVVRNVDGDAIRSHL